MELRLHSKPILSRSEQTSLLNTEKRFQSPRVYPPFSINTMESDWSSRRMSAMVRP